MKIGFQLKQVRERLAKGLVDKGVLRTEKRNFLLFDMATHPVADVRTKENLITRIISLLTSTTSAVPSAALDVKGYSVGRRELFAWSVQRIRPACWTMRLGD